MKGLSSANQLISQKLVDSGAINHLAASYLSTVATAAHSAKSVPLFPMRKSESYQIANELILRFLQRFKLKFSTDSFRSESNLTFTHPTLPITRLKVPNTSNPIHDFVKLMKKSPKMKFHDTQVIQALLSRVPNLLDKDTKTHFLQILEKAGDSEFNEKFSTIDEYEKRDVDVLKDSSHSEPPKVPKKTNNPKSRRKQSKTATGTDESISPPSPLMAHQNKGAPISNIQISGHSHNKSSRRSHKKTPLKISPAGPETVDLPSNDSVSSSPINESIVLRVDQQHNHSSRNTSPSKKEITKKDDSNFHVKLKSKTTGNKSVPNEPSAVIAQITPGEDKYTFSYSFIGDDSSNTASSSYVSDNMSKNTDEKHSKTNKSFKYTYEMPKKTKANDMSDGSLQYSEPENDSQPKITKSKQSSTLRRDNSENKAHADNERRASTSIAAKRNTTKDEKTIDKNLSKVLNIRDNLMKDNKKKANTKRVPPPEIPQPEVSPRIYTLSLPSDDAEKPKNKKSPHKEKPTFNGNVRNYKNDVSDYSSSSDSEDEKIIQLQRKLAGAVKTSKAKDSSSNSNEKSDIVSVSSNAKGKHSPKISFGDKLTEHRNTSRSSSLAQQPPSKSDTNSQSRNEERKTTISAVSVKTQPKIDNKNQQQKPPQTQTKQDSASASKAQTQNVSTTSINSNSNVKSNTYSNINSTTNSNAKKSANLKSSPSSNKTTPLKTQDDQDLAAKQRSSKSRKSNQEETYYRLSLPPQKMEPVKVEPVKPSAVKQNTKDTKQNEKDTKQNTKDTKQNTKDTKQSEKDTKQNTKDTKQVKKIDNDDDDDLISDSPPPVIKQLWESKRKGNTQAIVLTPLSPSSSSSSFSSDYNAMESKAKSSSQKQERSKPEEKPPKRQQHSQASSRASETKSTSNSRLSDKRKEEQESSKKSSHAIEPPKKSKEIVQKTQNISTSSATSQNLSNSNKRENNKSRIEPSKPVTTQKKTEISKSVSDVKKADNNKPSTSSSSVLAKKPTQSTTSAMISANKTESKSVDPKNQQQQQTSSRKNLSIHIEDKGSDISSSSSRSDSVRVPLRKTRNAKSRTYSDLSCDSSSSISERRKMPPLKVDIPYHDGHAEAFKKHYELISSSENFMDSESDQIKLKIKQNYLKRASSVNPTQQQDSKSKTSAANFSLRSGSKTKQPINDSNRQNSVQPTSSSNASTTSKVSSNLKSSVNTSAKKTEPKQQQDVDSKKPQLNSRSSSISSNTSTSNSHTQAATTNSAIEAKSSSRSSSRLSAKDSKVTERSKSVSTSEADSQKETKPRRSIHQSRKFNYNAVETSANSSKSKTRSNSENPKISHDSKSKNESRSSSRLSNSNSNNNSISSKNASSSSHISTSSNVKDVFSSRITVVSSEDLPKVDTFFILYIEGQNKAKRTKTTLGKTSSKTFNESFDFDIQDGNSSLVVQAKKEDLINGDSPISLSKVNLMSLPLNRSQEKWVSLAPNGKVRLILERKSKANSSPSKTRHSVQPASQATLEAVSDANQNNNNNNSRNNKNDGKTGDAVVYSLASVVVDDKKKKLVNQQTKSRSVSETKEVDNPDLKVLLKLSDEKRNADPLISSLVKSMAQTRGFDDNEQFISIPLLSESSSDSEDNGKKRKSQRI